MTVFTLACNRINHLTQTETLNTLCYTQKYTWMKWCLLYKLEYADYESELKNVLSRPVFFCKIDFQFIAFLTIFYGSDFIN